MRPKRGQALAERKGGGRVKSSRQKKQSVQGSGEKQDLLEIHLRDGEAIV